MFTPGSSHTAMTPITVEPAGLSCLAEISLVDASTLEVAATTQVSFVSNAVEQDISLPVVMPVAEGIYLVYLDILSSDEQLLAAYQAIENVVVGEVSYAFSYSNISCSCPKEPDSAWHYFIATVTVTNNNPVTTSTTVTLHRYYAKDPTYIKTADSRVIELAPGESTMYEYNSYAKARVTSNELVHFYFDDLAGGESSLCSAHS